MARPSDTTSSVAKARADTKGCRSAKRWAARLCDGWLSMQHTLASIRPQLRRLAKLRAERPFSVTVHACECASPGEVDEWAGLGVDPASNASLSSTT